MTAASSSPDINGQAQKPLVAMPRKKSTWMELWSLPDQAALIDGDENFPDIHQRQRHLAAVVLDASIVLHVYEKLKEGKSLESLKRCFPCQLTPEEEAILARPKNENELAQPEQAARNEARMVKLVEMSRQGRLLNRELLVKPDVLDTNALAAAEYDRALYTKSKKLDDASKWVPWMKRPSDPRIVAMQKLPDFVVTLFDPGPKSLESIEGKKLLKNKKTCELADLNRFGVMQDSPEYRNDFNHLLALLFPPKRVTFSAELFNKLRTECFPDAKEAKELIEVLIPQLFVEPPKVFNHRYSAQYTIVAIDRRKGEHDEMLMGTDNTATFAEIKNFSRAMKMAEEKTGMLKSLDKALEDPSLYMNKAMLERREALRKSYNTAFKAFEGQRKQFPSNERRQFVFPQFLNWDIENAERYSALHEQIGILSARLPDNVKSNSAMMAPLQDLHRKLEDPDLYLTKALEERRAAFKTAYDEIRSNYHARLSATEQNDKTLLLPKIDYKFNLEDEKEYAKLRKVIKDVQRKLNMDAITADTKPWRAEYVGRAIVQREVSNSGTKYRSDGKMRKKGFGKDFSAVNDKDPAANHGIPDSDLERIARGTVEMDQSLGTSHPNSFTLEDIKRRVTAEIIEANREKSNGASRA